MKKSLGMNFNSVSEKSLNIFFNVLEPSVRSATALPVWSYRRYEGRVNPSLYTRPVLQTRGDFSCEDCPIIKYFNLLMFVLEKEIRNVANMSELRNSVEQKLHKSVNNRLVSVQDVIVALLDRVMNGIDVFDREASVESVNCRQL